MRDRFYLAVVIAVPLLTAWLVGAPFRRHPISHQEFVSMKIVVETLRHAPTIHSCPDGRIDVYRTLFEDMDLVIDNVMLLHNSRAEVGPSMAEVRAGDYANFPWERARVGSLGGDPVPMLWDPRAFHDHRLVGFSNGAVKLLTEQEFAELR